MIDDYPCPSIETAYETEIDLNNLPFIENEIKGNNNILYNIKIYNAKYSIIFYIKKINDFLVINYKNEYTFEQLKKIDIFFKSFKSIEEIYIDFFQNFTKKEIIILENENTINLNIKFEHVGKMKKIIFNFDIYNLNMEKTIYKLCDKMKEINNFNINIKEIEEKINIIQNNEKNIDENIKKISEKNSNKDILDKFNKLKEEIKINEENFDKNEINENNKKEIEKCKKQLEEKRKKTFIMNNIFIISIIILNLIFINSNINNKINNIDNDNNNLLNEIEELINNMDNKYNDKINYIENKINHKGRYQSFLEKLAELHRIYMSKTEEIENKYDNKIKYIEKIINDQDNEYDNKINDINLQIYNINNLFKSKINDIKNYLAKKVEDFYNNYSKKIIDIDNQMEEFNDNYYNKIIDIDNKYNNKIIDLDNSVKFITMYNKYYYIFKSLINYEDFKTLTSFINEGIKKYFDKEVKNIKLLYQGSRDGFDNNIFHEKCDGNNFTVTLFVTEENIIFGGFTELDWDKNGDILEGSKGFVFYLNEKKIYYNSGKYIIKGEKYSGPFFFDVFNIDSRTEHTFLFSHSQYFNIPEEEYNRIWKDNIPLKDYAVYHIEF